MGKTTVMINMIRKNKELGYSVGVVTIEMSFLEIAHLVTSQMALVPSTKFTAPADFTQDEMDRVYQAFKMFAANKIAIQESGDLNLTDFENAIVRMKRDYPDLAIVYLDHLHILSEAISGDMRAGVTKISGRLKVLAKKHNIVIVALAQLNRETDKRENKEPWASDLKESGSIEQDADAIIMVYRDNYYVNEDEDEDEDEPYANKYGKGKAQEKPKKLKDSATKLIVRKNRHGGALNWNVRFEVDEISQRMVEL